MIRTHNEYRTEVRKAMRGGDGEVKIEHFWDSDEMNSNTRMCAKLTLEPGCSIGFHTHDKEEEIFVVVQGEAEVNDNGENAKVGPGDTIITGNGAGHAIKNIGKDTLVLVAVIACF